MPDSLTTRPGVWPPAPQHAPQSWTVDGTTLTRSDEQLTVYCPRIKWIPFLILAIQTPLFALSFALSVRAYLRTNPASGVPLFSGPDLAKRLLLLAGFYAFLWLASAYGDWIHYERLGRGHFAFSRSPNQVLAGSSWVCGLGEIRFVQVRRQFFYVGMRYVVSFVYGDVRRGLHWRRPARAMRNPERRSRILTFFRNKADAESVAQEIAAFVGVEVNALWA